MDPIQQEKISQLEHEIHELQARNRDRDFLDEIRSNLWASRTSPEAYQILAYCAPQLFPDVQGALYLRNEVVHSTFEQVTAWGALKQRKRFEREQCWALQHMRPHRVEATPCSGLACEHAGSTEDGCYLCVPLLAEGVALGVLHLRGDRKAFSPFKRKIAEKLGGDCAMRLASLRRQELLSDQAIRDPLTKLFNLRYLEESLRRELAARGRRPISVIMADIDHFKQYNTNFTYEGANELLRVFGRFLQVQIRPEDIACRYGGEEFVLIMPGATLDVTERRAERLREAVKHLNATYKGRTLERITLSLGVAAAHCGSTAEDLLGRVAWAVGEAKAQGRDRVVVAPC